MRNAMYSKLAASNIKKNSKTYLPYMLTSIGIIAMFYNIESLSVNPGLESMTGGSGMKEVLHFGTWIIGIFSVIFLFYINSFLIKRRKKEFGLYNILGMEKRHIAKIAAFETLYTSAISVAAGIFGGMLLSKLIRLVLLKILHLEVQFGFEVSPASIVTTVLIYGSIFILTFVYNMLQIRSAKPIELLSGGKTGEKEPKTKLIMSILGAICLAVAYYISLTTDNPAETLGYFFIAVILVIIGTYMLFTAGSIALLKLLRKNKKYYYKKNHFTTVSGMIYRMKQNAAGLASICILSTMVLVTVSATVSLYVGVDDVLNERYPKNISLYALTEDADTGYDIVRKTDDILKAENLSPVSPVRYFEKSMYLERNGSSFISVNDKSGHTVNTKMTFFILDDYKRLADYTETLSEDEILIYPNNTSRTVMLGEKEYSVKNTVDGDFISNIRFDETDTLDKYYAVVPDFDSIVNIYNDIFEGTFSEDDEINNTSVGLYYKFDLSANNDTQAEMTERLSKTLKDEFDSVSVTGKAINRVSIYHLYGGIFFLGIFLGFLFIMATVLIIYYKQISEGYDDKERFNIMQKIGMSRIEVKKAIRSQILTVFFLPLIMACVHIAFAFKVITKLLRMFYLTNINLFIMCTLGTVLVFVVLYTVVYVLTAKAYYKIVR